MMRNTHKDLYVFINENVEIQIRKFLLLIIGMVKSVMIKHGEKIKIISTFYTITKI